MTPDRRTQATYLSLILAAGLVVRLYLIYRHPIIFGGDTIARLAKADHIVLSHNLPLLQAAIHYLAVLSRGPLPVQCFMAVVGSVAGAGFYLLLSTLVPPRVALDGSFLFLATPLVLVDSIVPYPEILMLAGMLFGFYFAFTERWYLASLSLGLACLSRYEAWIACPVLALAYVNAHNRTPRALLAAGALFGWAPLGWMVYNVGITPAGSYAIERWSSPERLLRWAHLVSGTMRGSTVPTLLLAAGGAVVVLRKRLLKTAPFQMLLAALALFLVAILFSAHGVGDRPDQVVTGREAHIPLVGVAILATLGLGALPRFRELATILTVSVGLWAADRMIQRATREPHLALSYRVARYVDSQVPPGDTVAVLARGRGADAERALVRLERQRGPAAVEQALETLRDLDMAKPEDYQRIFVHSRRSKDRLVSFASLELGRYGETTSTAPTGGRPQWIVLWSDFVPTNAIETGLAAQVLARDPREVFHQDSVWVRLYYAPNP